MTVTRVLKCPAGRFLLEGIAPDGLNIRVRCGCKGLDTWIAVDVATVSIRHLPSAPNRRQDDFSALHRPGNTPTTASIGTHNPGGARP